MNNVNYIYYSENNLVFMINHLNFKQLNKKCKMIVLNKLNLIYLFLILSFK